jgi:uncharacterized protein YgbK (DUF1537 family)
MEKKMNNEWKKVSIDGKERLMRKAEMQSDLVEAFKEYKEELTKEEQDFTEKEKKRNEETKVVPQDGFFEFKK